MKWNRRQKSPLGPFLPNPLDDVYAFLGKFLSYPSDHARVAHALWIVHTHLMDKWESTPRLAFLSAEPGSGKTRALELSETMVPRPIEAINATPAYLFRKISDPGALPTVLYDEIDTVFGPRARENEELRGVLTQDIDVGPSLAGASSEERRLKRKSCQPFVRWPWQD